MIVYTSNLTGCSGGLYDRAWFLFHFIAKLTTMEENSLFFTFSFYNTVEVETMIWYLTVN